ncbi:MAG: sugar phosphate isomerase/epimerase [Candidatus Omnitrophica bacterium]|nr:sugar phosphate isomerase/epimerase [Candidatus Omnitrophota bacterium]MCM8808577.1 sugar phosphate isomerase/epimerase [Candidatus Omnitrophota bacterium]MCM8810894.1 sugar phosphate isomerase/epimerase [Candidatus Omnitrophota bacterium]
MFRNISFEAINIKTTFLEQLRLAKLGNFEGIDISILDIYEFSKNDRVEKIKNLIDSFDLKIGGWCLPFSISEEENKFNQDLEKLEQYLKIAKKISANRIYTWIIPFSDNLPYKENFEFHLKRAEKLCKLIEKYSCRIGFEFIGTKSVRVNHKYEFIWNLEQMLEFLKKLKIENTGILLDSWHLYASEGKIQDIEKLKGEDIIYVHVNDAPNIPKDQLIDNERFLPGETGVIDLIGLLRVLKKIKYDGPVTPEPFNKRVNQLPNEISVKLIGGYLLKIFARLDLI